MFSVLASGSLLYAFAPRLGRVKHGFSMRLGGVSSGRYESLNLGLHVGDDPARVKINRQRWAGVFGIKADQVVAGHQVHGTKVAVVGREHWGRGADSQDTAIPDCDALVSVEPGTALMSFYADCIPIFFYDPVTKGVGIAHAGWKGTLAGIAQKTVKALQTSFGVDPKTLVAAIGPSIGPCCFEVSPDLAGRFSDVFGDDVVKHNWKYRPTVDLWKANETSLLSAGLCRTNIVRADLCTACHPQLLYSYRYERGPTGRMAAFIVVPGR